MDISEVSLELQKDLSLHNQNTVQLIESGQYISYKVGPPIFLQNKEVLMPEQEILGKQRFI